MSSFFPIEIDLGLKVKGMIKQKKLKLDLFFMIKMHEFAVFFLKESRLIY